MPGLPIKFKNYLKFDVTTGANNCGVWHTIEDVRTVQGLHTYSFYARGTNPSSGQYELDFRQYFGSGSLTMKLRLIILFFLVNGRDILLPLLLILYLVRQLEQIVIIEFFSDNLVLITLQMLTVLKLLVFS